MNEPTTSKEKQLSTDWTLCVLCQQATSEHLQCPANSKKKCGNGWVTLANNLIRFQRCDSMPLSIDLARIDERNGIEASLKKNFAKWHKSCSLKFNNQAVERAERKRRSNDDDSGSRKFTRKQAPAVISKVYFLCDEVTKEDLRNVETYSLDEKVRKSAFDLQDEKLIDSTGG